MCSHPQDFTPELVGMRRCTVFLYLGATARPQIRQLHHNSNEIVTQINKPRNFPSHINHVRHESTFVNGTCHYLFTTGNERLHKWNARMICGLYILLHLTVLIMCNIIVYSVSLSGSRWKFHHRPSAVQHVALPQRVWLPSRLDKIFTGVKRCILLIQCEILLLSLFFPITLLTMG